MPEEKPPAPNGTTRGVSRITRGRSFTPKVSVSGKVDIKARTFNLNLGETNGYKDSNTLNFETLEWVNWDFSSTNNLKLFNPEYVYEDDADDSVKLLNKYIEENFTSVPDESVIISNYGVELFPPPTMRALTEYVNEISEYQNDLTELNRPNCILKWQARNSVGKLDSGYIVPNFSKKYPKICIICKGVSILDFDNNTYNLEEKNLQLIAKNQTRQAQNLPTIGRGNCREPILYLYDNTNSVKTVRMPKNKEYTELKPQLNNNNEWVCTTTPNGIITMQNDNSTHNYLFWEGIKEGEYLINQSNASVLYGCEFVPLFTEILAKKGLIATEYNKFINFWKTYFKDDKKYVVTFVNKEYNDDWPIEFEPKPLQFIRVFIAFKEISEADSVGYNQLKNNENEKLSKWKNNKRPTVEDGYYAVEWGGICHSE